MTVVNDFVPFATGGSANVISQAAYLGMGALPTGFETGVAQSNQVNKVLRQASFVSAALMQFVANTLNINTPDDGNFTGAVTNITNAIQSAISGSSGIVVLAGTSFNVLNADNRKIYVATAAIAVGLPAPGTLSPSWRIDFYAYQGVIILIPGSGGNLNGTTSNLTLPQGFTGTITCDGTNFYFEYDYAGIAAAIAAAAPPLASHSAAGIIKTALSSDVTGISPAGTSSTLAVTPASLVPFLPPVGFGIGILPLFSTYLIQWGTVPSIGAHTNVSLTFPIAFNQGVGYANYSGSANDSTGDAMQTIVSRSTTGMTLRNQSGVTQDLNWFVIGN